MASRMDRYSKQELMTSGRSTKNKDLYKQIENLETYTNIEGVATIEKTNEIDITKVQEMLKNRENYKKQRQFRPFIKEEVVSEKQEDEQIEETKNYNINDLLMKAKAQEQKTKTYRKLDDKQIELLKSLNRKNNEYDVIQEEKELKELINTISSNKELNELSKTNDDVGLLDELKSDTMVGNASSIKKIIEEEKKDVSEDENTQMDKSFYTSSFGFTSNDFEELKNMNHTIKKSNKFIIILLIILIALVIGTVIFFLVK